MKATIAIRSTTSVSTSGGTTHHVSLPAAPWGGDLWSYDPRAETAPRRGILSPKRTTAEMFVAELREARDQMREDRA